jgi:putative two-component system response regulator
MRILVVDDQELDRELLAAVLSDAGHEVREAANGEDALAVLRQGTIRLMITDWNMPGMNGPDLCHQIRIGGLPTYVYVIILTSRDEHADRLQALSRGADDFLSKPFDPDELRLRVNVAARILSLETRHAATFALAKLAESRDPETGKHLERIRAYSWILARELATVDRRVDAAFIENIYLTSPLHDIGKVGIPDSVLLKPDSLTDREFEIMKTHTTVGGRTLDATLQQYPEITYFRMARDIALSHHERFDGTGYPRGLEGDEIPLCGRIVGLADVYDALTSKRVYKDVMEHDIAKRLIVEESGSHFDPAVVETFLRVEDEFVGVRHLYSDEHAGVL